MSNRPGIGIQCPSAEIEFCLLSQQALTASPAASPAAHALSSRLPGSQVWAGGCTALAAGTGPGAPGASSPCISLLASQADARLWPGATPASGLCLRRFLRSLLQFQRPHLTGTEGCVGQARDSAPLRAPATSAPVPTACLACHRRWITILYVNECLLIECWLGTHWLAGGGMQSRKTRRPIFWLRVAKRSGVTSRSCYL